MTAQPAKPQGGARRHAKEMQDEVARSLERELKFLTADREERALHLGLDFAAKTPKTNH